MLSESLYMNNAAHGSWFQSGEYPITSGRCFSFWYARKYGVFKVLIMQNRKTNTLWQMPLTKPGIWMPARFNIISAVKYRVCLLISFQNNYDAWLTIILSPH